MRVAIAVWNDRISPVFDTSSRLVLVDVEQGAERGRRTVEVGADSFPTQRARRVTELEVNVLICGAISRPLAELVSASGVVVIPWVSGPVEGVLRAYLTKRLSDSRWRMPGCRGRRRHRRTPSDSQSQSQSYSRNRARKRQSGSVVSHKRR
jgi:predicted Fe-Mo cluster-binding NifX family protein